MTPEVLQADPEPSGLAMMLADLLRQNLARDPGRARSLMPMLACIEAPDAGVAVTMRVAPGRVVLADGVDTEAGVTVRADSGRLLRLTAAPLLWGLPDVRSSRGRRALADILTGRVRVRGMVRHPGQLRRLTRLLSVR